MKYTFRWQCTECDYDKSVTATADDSVKKVLNEKTSRYVEIEAFQVHSESKDTIEHDKKNHRVQITKTKGKE